MKYILRCPKCFSTNLKFVYKENYDFVCLECDKKNFLKNMDVEEDDDNKIVTIQKNLTKEQKMILIEKFHEMYCNTDQDTQDFASEFYNIVNLISIGHIPVKLEFLIDFQEEILDLIKEMKVQE